MKFTVVKPYTQISIFVLSGLGTLLSVMFFMWGFLMGGLLFLILSLAFALFFSYHCMMKKVIINEQGVTYIAPGRRYEMRWNEISSIGILHYHPIRNPMMYFTSDDSYNQKVVSVFAEKIDESYFRMEYRKKAEAEIKKYWHEPFDRYHRIFR